MSRLVLLLVGLIASATTAGQTTDDQRRSAYRERVDRLIAIEQRMRETRPIRRDGPMRTENIRDEEVREIRTAVSQVLPGAIANISAVVVGCPCEDGPGCSDQVWVLAYQPDPTTGLQLSKINHHWTIGAIQRWWLEYEKLEARRRSFRSSWSFYEAQEKLKEQFPICVQPTTLRAPG